MKQLVGILLLLMIGFNSNAQGFEGKIVFAMDFGKMDEQTKAMMPTESVAYYKNGNARVEMSMGMGMKNTTITKSEEKKTVILMDMMGQKMAITTAGETPEGKKMTAETKVTVTSETKMIAGYKCTKAIMEIPTKDKETQRSEVWFTKELGIPKTQLDGPMSKIDGAILQYSMVQGPITITLTAKEITKQTVDNSMFVVPDGYKVMTMEEFQQSMGGGKK